MKSKTYTSGKVAKMLGLPARTVRRYILSGRIPAEQNPLTKRWRVPEEALDIFMHRYQLELPPLQSHGRVLLITRRAEVTEPTRAVLGRLTPALTIEQVDDIHRALLLAGRAQPELVIADLSLTEWWPAVRTLSEDCTARRARLILVGGEAGFPDLNGAPVHRLEPAGLEVGLEALIRESLEAERTEANSC